MISDETLMLDFQRGSLPAFEELFARYREPLYGFFRRRLGSGEASDDLTQETFLAVIRATARYEPRALVRAYLYGIAFKLVSAERRKLGRDQPADLTAISSHDSDERLWVRQALDRLDANNREILMLREYEQLSYGEIAELLRLPRFGKTTRPSFPLDGFPCSLVFATPRWKATGAPLRASSTRLRSCYPMVLYF